jgi:hypothetical protein
MLARPPEPAVLLAEHEDGDGFCVSVVPPPAGVGHDRCFGSYLDARAYARLLRFGNGWEIVDRVDPKTRKAAEEAEQRRLEARHG